MEDKTDKHLERLCVGVAAGHGGVLLPDACGPCALSSLDVHDIAGCGLVVLQGAAARYMCTVRFGAWVLVLMQDAAAGLLPDAYGSLSFGACLLVSLSGRCRRRCQMFMAVHDLECGCRCMLPTNIFCCLGSMLA